MVKHLYYFKIFCLLKEKNKKGTSEVKQQWVQDFK